MRDIEARRWAASGAAALTGRADGPPLGPPGTLVALLDVAARPLGGIDPLARLTERAACTGASRRGTTSVGGGSRLLAAPEGEHLAVSLPRDDDRELVPAWLEVDVDPADEVAVWRTVTAQVADRPAGPLVARAAELGLPVARLGEVPPPARRWRGLPVAAALVDPTATPPPQRPRVVDLTALWAGPLCASLLAAAGMEVVKVESTTRPDGARRGPRRFYDRLNGGARSVALPLAEAEGRADLHRLIASADVVLTSARPRALESLGLEPHHHLRRGRPRVWAAITAHGATGPGAHRVGFGDDAAVAGGLVARDDRGPTFCADAVADPLAGLVTAAAVQGTWEAGGSWFLDVALSRCAAAAAGATHPLPDEVECPPPTPPTVGPTAADLGADTEAILTDLRP